MNVRSPQNAATPAGRDRALAELQQAAADEAAATKARAAAFRSEVVSGRLLPGTGDGHVYSFQLQTVLPVADDVPGELHIGGQVYTCRVVALAGLRVSVLLDTAPAPVIERAVLVTQPWIALERLRGALEDFGASRGSGPGLSAALLAGESTASGQIDLPAALQANAAEQSAGRTPPAGANAASHTPAPPTPELSQYTLSESQQEALAAALGRSVAVIAGPASAGKTRLLGMAAAACAAAGLRVLMLAPSNDAVDDMLAAYIESGGRAACEAGQALRLGCSAAPGRWQAYPQLTPRVVAERLQADLEAELAGLAAEHATEAARDQELRVLRKAVDLARQAAGERDAVQAEVDALQPPEPAPESPAGEVSGAERLRDGLRGMWQRARRLAQRSAPGGRSLYRDDAERRRQDAYGRAQRRAEAQRRLADKMAAAGRLRSSLERQLTAYGLAESEVTAACAETAARLSAVDEKRTACARALRDVGRVVRAQAQVVASTTQHALLVGEFEAASYDIVLIDDAHRLPMPHCSWAAGLASARLVIAAETGALPPWHCAQEAVALRWLGRSVVEHVASAGGLADGWLVNLTERHGLHTGLTAAVADWFGGMARVDGARPSAGARPPAGGRHILGKRRTLRRSLPARGHTVALDRALAGESPLALVDTAPLKSWCEVIPQEGRLNLASARAAVALAARLLERAPATSIALVSPYAAQARLLLRVARAQEATINVDVFAPPCLPTRGADVVILDTVETPGTFAWSPLDDTRPDSQAAAFLRDVCTQARQRVFVVAHWKHVRDTFGSRACLRRMLGDAVAERWAVSAAKLVPSQRAGALPRTLAAAADGMGTTSATRSAGWRLFAEDLQAAERHVTVWSPHLNLATVERCLSWLPSALLERGAVRLVTLPSGQRGGPNTQAAEARLVCEQMGVRVEERGALAANLVIVDDRLAWDCTFPPLGVGSRGAEMRRVESAPIARALRGLLSAPVGGDAPESLAAFLPFTGASAGVEDVIADLADRTLR